MPPLFLVLLSLLPPVVEERGQHPLLLPHGSFCLFRSRLLLIPPPTLPPQPVDARERRDHPLLVVVGAPPLLFLLVDYDADCFIFVTLQMLGMSNI